MEVTLDKQGRILLPPYLRTYAKLDKDVVLAGVGTKFEIWDQVRFEERRLQVEASFDADLAALAETGFMREMLHTEQLQGHLAIVVGAGASGRAAAKLLARLGASVRFLEKNVKAATESFRAEAEAGGYDLRLGAHAAQCGPAAEARGDQARRGHHLVGPVAQTAYGPPGSRRRHQ